MDGITTVQIVTALLRDIGIIVGIPATLYIAHKLYRQQLNILKDKNELLKAAQYDNALAYFNSQEILYMKKIEKLNRKISGLSDKMKEDSEYMVKYKRVLDETNHEMHMFQVIRKTLTKVIELDALKKLKEIFKDIKDPENKMEESIFISGMHGYHVWPSELAVMLRKGWVQEESGKLQLTQYGLDMIRWQE